MSLSPLISALIIRRKARGITQEEAAEMAGLSLKTYQRIENGSTDMRMKNYDAVLRGMKMTHLDICLDVIGVSIATAWDVAAAARLLSTEARAAIVSMIMIIYRDKIDKD